MSTLNLNKIKIQYDDPTDMGCKIEINGKEADNVKNIIIKMGVDYIVPEVEVEYIISDNIDIECEGSIVKKMRGVDTDQFLRLIERCKEEAKITGISTEEYIEELLGLLKTEVRNPMRPNYYKEAEAEYELSIHKDNIGSVVTEKAGE